MSPVIAKWTSSFSADRRSQSSYLPCIDNLDLAYCHISSQSWLCDFRDSCSCSLFHTGNERKTSCYCSLGWFRDDPSIRSVVRKTWVNLVKKNRRGRSWSPTSRIRFIFVRTRQLVLTTKKVITAIPMNSLDWRVRPIVFDVSMSPSVSSMKPSDTISTQPGAIDWLNFSVRNPGWWTSSTSSWSTGYWRLPLPWKKWS